MSKSEIYKDINKRCNKINKHYNWYINNDNRLVYKKNAESMESMDICGIKENYFQDKYFQEIFDPCYSDSKCNTGVLEEGIYDGKYNELCDNSGDKCRTNKENLYDVMKDMNNDKKSKGGDKFINDKKEEIYNSYVNNKKIIKDEKTLKKYLKHHKSLNTLHKREFDDKYDTTQELLDKEKIKFPDLEISSLLNQYNKLIGGDKDDKDNIITKEFEDLTELSYWSSASSVDYAINIKKTHGKNELIRILDSKLSKNHAMYDMLNNSKDKKITDKIIYNIFNIIRKHTSKFIKDKELKKYIDKNYKHKLLQLEIGLYIHQLDKINKDNFIPDSKITDENLHILYPEQIKIIANQYETNYEFRSCVNNQISKDERDIILKYSDKNLTDLNETEFVEYSDTLESILIHIKEMNSHTMYACMERVINPSDICNGELIEEYLQLLMVFFQFININTNLNSRDTEKVNGIVEKTFPHMKAIFKNLIEYSRAHPSCNTKKTKNKMEMYEKIYYQLFEKSKPEISYNLFDNVNWDNNFFTVFTETMYGKIILLVFLAFIFSKLVSLFSSTPPEVVTPK
tara:strand:+ start:2949 stop:4658 length:1710 start_codon:yes stop_codon:yes gene_type:complete